MTTGEIEWINLAERGA